MLINIGADIAFVGTAKGESVRISARAKRDAVSAGVNLGQLMEDVSNEYNGTGGGHSGAAGIDVIGDMSENEILTSLEEHFGIRRETIDLIALTYSMGDGFSTIMDVRNLEGRGLKSIEGAGKKTGGGTRVFDAIRNSGVPAIAIPGLHTESKVDPRMKVFSHLTSPEKLGIAYHILCLGYNNFVVSDISSNTVTLAIADGKVIGAIDACIFAPGVHHGPLDLQAIRDVDNGYCTANQAFMEAGALKMTPYKDREELLLAAGKEESPALLALDTIALFAAMLIGGKLAVCQFSVKSQISRSYWVENSISEDQLSS